ncbi:unnamed protein product [Phaeothamnion confervicola]
MIYCATSRWFSLLPLLWTCLMSSLLLASNASDEPSVPSETAAEAPEERMLHDAYVFASKALHPKANDPRVVLQAVESLREVANSKGDPATVAAARRELGELHLSGISGGVVRRDWSHALALLNSSATLGDAVASHLMAYTLSTGAEIFGLKVDEERAAKLEETAALQGYVPAVKALGWRYRYGIGVRRDCETALMLYKEVAASVVASELEPLFSLSKPLGEDDYLHERHIGTWRRRQQYSREARAYYETAAGKGDPDATYHLGRLYELGENGMPKNATLGAKWYAVAVDKWGDVRASSALGFLLATGHGVPLDIDRAVDLLEYAAAQDDSRAVALLGYIHQYGAGVDLDVAKARALYAEAARADEPLALFSLAEMLLAEGNSFEALTYYARAADAGHLLAAQQMATMLELGLGAWRTCKDAVEMYKLVAEAGESAKAVRAAYALAAAPETEEAALLALTRAAAEGVEVAQTNAAFMLVRRRGYRGSGGAPAAVRLLSFAAAQESVEAEAELGRLKYGGGGGVPVDVVAAAQHLERAARAGHLDATERLARMFASGRGVRQDLERAEALYTHLLSTSPLPRIGEWDALARKAGLGLRVVHIRTKVSIAKGLAALQDLVAALRRRTGGGGGRGGGRPRGGKGGGGGGDGGCAGGDRGSDGVSEATGGENSMVVGTGGGDASARKGGGGGGGGRSGGDDDAEEEESDSNLFFIIVDDGTDPRCLNSHGRLGACDESAMWTGVGSSGHTAIISLWERTDSPDAAALCLTEASLAPAFGAPSFATVAPFAGAASHRWNLAVDQLTTDRGERCLAPPLPSAQLGAGVPQPCVVQPSVRGCATVSYYYIPGFLIESEGRGDCFNGEAFVPCDTHDRSLRWAIRLTDTEGGGQYMLHKVDGSGGGGGDGGSSNSSSLGGACLIVEDGALRLGPCDSRRARRWSLAGGRLCEAGYGCVAAAAATTAAEKPAGARARGPAQAAAAPVAAALLPFGEGYEELGLRF